MGQIESTDLIEKLNKMFKSYIEERGLRTDTFNGASAPEILIIVAYGMTKHPKLEDK